MVVSRVFGNQKKDCSFLYSKFLLLKLLCLRRNIKHSTVLNPQMKHLEVCQKYAAATCFFNSLFRLVMKHCMHAYHA